MTGRHLSFSCALLLFIGLSATIQNSSVFAQSQDVVLYASEAPVKAGGWSTVSDITAAGGFRISNPNAGAPKLASAAANPSNYFEFTFAAEAGKPYRLWIRGKAQDNSPYNDSVFVQFSGSVTSGGTAVYRIGTNSSTEYNLEDCFGCGLSGWGWQDNGWGIGVLGPQIFFQSTGTQTIRIQTREDGLSIDQIILSPSTYLFTSPGALKNDTVVVPKPSPTPLPTPTPTPTPTPSATASEIVVWAMNVAPSSMFGAWAKQTSSTAAGQVLLRHPNQGAAKLTSALANPTNYFQVSFNAVAGQPYRLWIRGRADNDNWANDSVFVQFSGSNNSSGVASYRIGTSSALEVNLEECSGCGLQGWGWQDPGWGIGVLGPVVLFSTTGTQTMRIQTREDGFSLDQMVLSPSLYLNRSPGTPKNDTVILNSTVGTPPANAPPQVSASASPLSGNSPLFVSFSSTASDPDGSISSYSWTFGDGHTASVPNPANTYLSAGSYTARLTVTDNAGAAASATVQINVSAPPPPSGATLLKVMSWNLAFVKGTDGILNYDRTATWLANINADLMGLCEINQDQIPTLVNLLNQKTGRTWQLHFVPKYSGTSEGNLILSKYGFVNVGSFFLSNQRSVARVTVTVGGKNINFFATHLDHTSSSIRYAQVGELTSWASNFAEPRIVVGDFNGGPDTSEIIRMAASYFDTWEVARSAGTATAYPDNPVGLHTRTRRGRIDYVFYSRGTSSVVVRGTQIPDSRDLSNPNVTVLLGTLDDRGVRPSDHNHMIATLEIR